ncbi:MAG: hypothetical protein WC861_05890 [Candidatus Micrarchaeia archaeon]|jgi:hypothetical protein
MSKIQVFANDVKSAAVKARETFFNLKKDGFEYKAVLVSRQVPLAQVAINRGERIGGTNVVRIGYGGRQ